jgi:transcriptional regulator with XRE-family HTH domain
MRSCPVSGEELRRRRLALGLSQPALAAQLGVHPNTVWRWELNGVPLLRVQLVRLSLERLEQKEATDAPPHS